MAFTFTSGLVIFALLTGRLKRLARIMDAFRADIALVERALENLIENALGHTPEKGTVIVEIFAGKDIEISVSDSGPGIPERELGQIFDRFYRSCNRTGGTHVGLGLAITRKIVELHGEELKVATAPGKGTRFYFRLPVAG